VCKPEQVIGVDSLIIPDGESTTKAVAVRSDDG
jgi:glutamine amidotransferase PdxT